VLVEMKAAERMNFGEAGKDLARGAARVETVHVRLR